MLADLGLDHRLDRCYLRGRVGDALNLVGSAVGFNTRKLLRLLGLGIFSRALLWLLLWWEFFVRFLRSSFVFVRNWTSDSQCIL